MTEEKERKPHPSKGRKIYRVEPERYAAARIIYETTPGITYARCAELTGISARSLEQQSKKDGGWNKNSLKPPKGMQAAAQEAADKYNGKVEKYGFNPTDAEKKEAIAQVSEEIGVDLRAQILDRHRREWGPIRALIYKNLRGGKFNEEVKLAKMSAEALNILQLAERKAWGLDKPNDTDKPPIVVIDRG